jgi:hypothetical protein
MRTPFTSPHLLPAAALLLGAAATASPAGAQSQPASGALSGVVFDSLVTQRALADAEVWVDGTNVTARTDREGRFRIPALPAGRYRVTFYHPTLESLGFTAPVKPVEIVAGGATTVQLFTPSPLTIYGALCPPMTEIKTGVLVGVVRRAGADSARAAAGSEITASWNVWTLGTGGMRQTSREATTRAAESGTFNLCGLPNDVPVQLRVQMPDGVVAVSEATLGERVVGVARVDVPAVPNVSASSGAQRGGGAAGALATIVGVVRGPGGRAVPNASVQVVGASQPPATTGEGGAFVVRDVTPGTVTVEARALGFRPVRTRLSVGAGQTAQVALTVSDNVVVLAATKVLSPRVAAVLAGFEKRRQSGTGNYVTAEEIAKRNPYSVPDVLVGIPGVQVILPPGDMVGGSPMIVLQRSMGTAGQGQDNATTRGVCQPVTYIDGVRFAYDLVGGVDALLRPQDIHGIEVYKNVAGAPPEFQPMNSSCGVILIWTKRGSK